MNRSATTTRHNPVLSVRLDARLRRRLERLARATDRTSSWLIQDAVASYLDTQEWQVQAIKESARNADRDPARAVSHDRVRAWVTTWGSKRELERSR